MVIRKIRYPNLLENLCFTTNTRQMTKMEGFQGFSHGPENHRKNHDFLFLLRSRGSKIWPGVSMVFFSWFFTPHFPSFSHEKTRLHRVSKPVSRRSDDHGPPKSRPPQTLRWPATRRSAHALVQATELKG